MARRNESFNGLSPDERNRVDGEKEMKLVKIVLSGVFIVIELILLFKVPSVAILLLLMFGKEIIPLITSICGKQELNFLKGNKEKENRVDWKQEKKATAKVEKKVNWKESGQKAAKKYVSRVTEAGAREKEFKSHPHTPVTYSYDSCAKEKRLEQIRTLKNAGLLTEAEYRERRSKILTEK